MAKRPEKLEHVSEEAVAIVADRAPKEHVSIEKVIVELVEMVRFLNANRNYWAEDYLSERTDSALGKLLSKHAK
jgi:hypothetical protein